VLALLAAAIKEVLQSNDADEARVGPRGSGFSDIASGVDSAGGGRRMSALVWG